MWDHDGDNRLNQEEFTDMLRSLDVDVDDSVKGRQSLISIAKAIGVSSPLVTFEQVIAHLHIHSDNFIT
jgi:Ca2+-binding EF-hand superfamily protein